MLRTKPKSPVRLPESAIAGLLIALAAALFIIFPIIESAAVSATPDGVTIIPIRNSTATPTAAGMVNTSGGTISTVNLNGTTQDVRWKAFIGNISGSFVLEDSSGSTIYSWGATSPSGEVYATRNPAIVNWTGIGCANSTHLANEDVTLNQTNKDDNITATFNTQQHSAFYVDVRQIAQNSCYSIHTYVNSTPQSTRFEEAALYDGTNLTNGKIVFTTLLEQNAYGYNNETYDFQMILPERGEPTWQGSTAYYFYVELS